MFAACREAKTPKPQIRFDAGGIWTKFDFDEMYLALISADVDGVTGGVPQETTQETTQEIILALLRRTPHITRKALAEQLEITPDGVKYHLGKLREAGRIRHVGPTKKGRWEVIGGDDE